MLRLLSLLISFGLLSSVSAQDFETELTQSETEEAILKHDLSHQNESRQEFKELVQNTIQLMGPETQSNETHAQAETAKPLTN